MKTTLLASALALAALPAAAKDKVIPLAPADAVLLQGKTVAVTLHERSDFGAMTAGKATFGLFGALAMIKAGNDLVDTNQVADPAIVLREQLAAGLREAYGVKLLDADTAVTKAKKAKEIAAAHPEADYVLSARSINWGYFYFPTDWNSYHVMYGADVLLIDAKTGRELSKARCTAGSKESKTPPSRDQLHADGARVLKDYSAALGWNCVQRLASAQFMIPADKIAATPEPYASLLVSFSPADNAVKSAVKPVTAPATGLAAPVNPASGAPADAAPPAVEAAPAVAPVKSEGEG